MNTKTAYNLATDINWLRGMKVTGVMLEYPLALQDDICDKNAILNGNITLGYSEKGPLLDLNNPVEFNVSGEKITIPKEFFQPSRIRRILLTADNEEGKIYDVELEIPEDEEICKINKDWRDLVNATVIDCKLTSCVNTLDTFSNCPIGIVNVYKFVIKTSAGYVEFLTRKI